MCTCVYVYTYITMNIHKHAHFPSVCRKGLEAMILEEEQAHLAPVIDFSVPLSTKGSLDK